MMAACILGGLQLPHVTVDCCKVVSEVRRDIGIVALGLGDVDAEDVGGDRSWTILLSCLSIPARIRQERSGEGHSQRGKDLVEVSLHVNVEDVFRKPPVSSVIALVQ